MKTSFIFACALLTSTSTSAFAPIQSNGRPSTAHNALADRIFGLDLFDQSGNKYGARSQKNLKVGKISENSYIPAGLTKAQYEKVRADEQKKKQDRYQKNVAKAGKFIDFTDWYAKRGTELSGGWKKSVTLGHSMAKTKFDWSGTADAKKLDSTRLVTPSKKTAAAPKKKPFSFF
jgi:hypothetical protein